jgi:hypothetical protein
MPDTTVHPLCSALSKFWTPVPWMLEAAIVLEVVLGKYVEAAVIAALLIFNAALGFFQESRAQATLAALKSRLALNASVRRDGSWKTVPAVGLVPGDIVKLSLGAVVAADVRLLQGAVLLDQSMLTGESMPIEAGPSAQTYAGALVRRGEATAEITATGTRTKFGRTAELVRTAHVTSSQQKAVLRIVRNLLSDHDDRLRQPSRGGIGQTGRTGGERSQTARQQGERPQGRPGKKPQEDCGVAAQCAAATPWASQEAVNLLIQFICARYGQLAIGRGDRGIRYRSASH